MPCFGGPRKRFAESAMCFSPALENDSASFSKLSTGQTPQAQPEMYFPILPGLPDDVAKYCLALIPRSHFPVMATVCKKWRLVIQSKEFITVRKQAGKLEEWLYVLTRDTTGKGSRWEVLGCLGDKKQLVPPMPGPLKAGCGVVVLDGKLLVMAGYSVDVGTECVSPDVYQYDSRLNRWSKLAKMNVARYDFACSEVDGVIYVVGGFGPGGDSLSCAEVYDPDKNKWTLIESLRRPRWGCFGCGLEGKFYVMGGRSTFTIGNSRFVDVYDPEQDSWCETKNGCVMVTAQAALRGRLFCMEWKHGRKLAIFDPRDQSWRKVPVPLSGSSTIGFCFGVLDGKLFLFSSEEDPGYRTLLYDPEAPPGMEWQTSALKPRGVCLWTVTIKA